ncbi:MAG: aconitate hydratase [Deltaproteobacteria bacterium]|nr:aconitate hydratase [Deltaproteobacteria bacterium]
MALNLTQKILQQHLVEGELIPGRDIAIRVDHVLLQDATGTVAMLEFEALGIPSVRAELAVQYVDHNILQTDHKNADDHKYLRTACARYGLYFSPAGNGVSHQVHMERFGVPGKTILGADSHTPGAAGISMLGIGAGGLDVALAMAGFPYHMPCPRVLGVTLTGVLPDWVSAKDVILEMLRRYGVKGCLGKVVEYRGPGVLGLSATDRETIGNMGTELGATSSIFPSDENTLTYLEAQGRGDAWVALEADEGAVYDEEDAIDLSTLEPLIACPSSPGNVVPVRDVAGIGVDQVIVGSSVNSSFRDLMVVARIVENRRAFAGTSFHINPGSRQVLENLAAQGGLMALLQAGARIHEPGCLGCIGMGQAPGTGEVSLRTMPRNFPGRSGTKDDKVYLCSPETAAAAALKGVITDPRDLAREMNYPTVRDPEKYIVDLHSIVPPDAHPERIEVVRGPNIRPLPAMDPLPDDLLAEVVLKVGDNVSTDTIMPGGNRVLPLRSNIEAISEFVYSQVDPEFHRHCQGKGAVIVVGGENYGQGSSREHAALAPRFLGVRAKVAKSFARIHKANLCNFGILPLTLKNAGDYDLFRVGSRVLCQGIRERIRQGVRELAIRVDGKIVHVLLDVSDLEREHLLAGGKLNHVRSRLMAG